MRTGISGKRAAMAHTLFNVVGVVLVLPLVYFGLYARFVVYISPMALTSDVHSLQTHIAIAHTLFNVSAAVVMLPLIGSMERLVLRIMPTRQKDIEDQPVTL